MDELVHRRGYTNIKATLLGFGDCYDEFRGQSTTLGLDAYVTFTSTMDGVAIAEHLNFADIGLCSDPTTPLNYPLVVDTRVEEEPTEEATVVGCLCTPLDLLGDRVQLPTAAIDDLVVIFQQGAYGLTASPTAFLGHPAPAEVLV